MADKTKIGYVFPSTSWEVEKGKIAEFAMAVSQKANKKDVKPIYADSAAAKAAGYDDIIAPPTFITSMSFWCGVGLIARLPVMGIKLQRLLHGEEEYEYFQPIHPGDTLTETMKIADVYEKEKKDKPGKFMEFTVLEMDIKNQRGELVLRSRMIAVER